MNSFRRSITAFSVLLTASCATVGSKTPDEAPRVEAAIAYTPPPGIRTASMLFEEMKTLAGRWEGTDQDGNPCASVFTVSSNGSVVRELMFPGEPWEMTNMIHLDDGRLVLTHYCGGGNQPRLVTTWSAASGVITFDLDRVSNLRDAPSAFMGHMTLRRTGPDAFTTEWTATGRSGSTRKMIFTMRRV